MASLTRLLSLPLPIPSFHSPKATSLARSLQKLVFGILEDQSYPLAYLHHRNAGGGYIPYPYLDGSLIRLQESVEVLQKSGFAEPVWPIIPRNSPSSTEKVISSRATDSPGMPFSYMCFKFLTCIGHIFNHFLPFL